MFSILNSEKFCYVGKVKDTLPAGEGVMFNNKMFIKSTWKEGKLNGDVQIYYNSENIACFFCGGLESVNKDYLPDGEGSMFYRNGSSYRGEFKNGMNHGKGTMLYHNGDIFTGEWKENDKEGFGKTIFQDGSHFTGYYKKSKRHGKGKFANANFVYECDWVNGEPDGEGIIDDNLGYRYEGGIKNGLRHGKGKYFFNGLGVPPKPIKTFVGNWFNNQIHGKGELIFVDDIKYVGDFVKNRRSGKGILYINENYRYESDWVNDKPHGMSKIYIDNKLYTGIIENGKFKGRYETKDEKGNITYGMIFKNKFVPESICETAGTLLNFKRRKIE